MSAVRAHKALTFGIAAAAVTGAAAVAGGLCPAGCPNCSQCMSLVPAVASAVAVGGAVGAARLLRGRASSARSSEPPDGRG